ERRWPFILDPESEQTKAIASARSSAGVKVGRFWSGFSSRICGVSIALITIRFAVAGVPLKESARARVQASAEALVDAYAAFPVSGFWAAAAETSTNRPAALAVRAKWKARLASWTVLTSRLWRKS